MQAAAAFAVCSQVVKLDIERGWLVHSFETGANSVWVGNVYENIGLSQTQAICRDSL